MCCCLALANEIRDYLRVADLWLQQGLDDGSLTIEEAKKHAAEMEKWQRHLAHLENHKPLPVHIR